MTLHISAPMGPTWTMGLDDAPVIVSVPYRGARRRRLRPRTLTARQGRGPSGLYLVISLDGDPVRADWSPSSGGRAGCRGRPCPATGGTGVPTGFSTLCGPSTDWR